MSMKMMNAAYLVDNVALLSLQEKQEGVEFHCFDMDSKVQIADGHIGWDVLDKQPSSTLEESARVVALQKISQLDGLAVAPVAPEMLEQVRGGRKVLWQMKKADPELENSLDFEVTPHLLRHTYITNLIHASVDPKTVQYLAGHENSKITMDIYAKAKYNRPDELAGILEDTFTLWDAE